MNQAIPPRTGKRSHLWIRVGTTLFALLLLVTLGLMWWWDHEPATFDVVKSAQLHASERGQPVVTGT